MKKIIFVLIVVLMFVFTGCASKVSEESAAGKVENKGELISEYYSKFDKLMLGTVWPITEYENYQGSRSSLNNVLTKIDKAEAGVKELEGIVGRLEKASIEKEFVSVNKEYLGLIKQLLDKHSKLYNHDLDLAELNAAGEKDNKLEELLLGVTKCTCGEMECDGYYTSFMNYQDSAVKTFADMGKKYGISDYAEISKDLEEEKNVIAKHMPGLIRKSKDYGQRRCYQINEPYAEFFSELDKIERISDDEIDAAIGNKLAIPIDNLINDIDALSVDFDRVRAEVEG